MMDEFGQQSRRSGKILWVKWAIAVSILIYLLLILDFSHVTAALQRAIWSYVAGGIFIVLVTRLLLAWQTAIALRQGGLTVTITGAFIVNTIVGFYGLFLPAAAAGGVIKWYRFSNKSGRGAEVFTGLLLQKAINLSVILFLGLIAFAVENPFDQPKLFWMVSSVLVCAISLWGLLVFLPPSKIDTYEERTAGRLPEKVRRWLRKLFVAFLQYKSIRAPMMVKMIAAAFIFQILVSGLFWLTAQALTLDLPLPSLVWVSAMVMLIQHIPFSIAGLGLREGALVTLMPRYGIPMSEAMAFSLIILGYSLILGLCGGLLEAWVQLTASSSRNA